MYHPYSDRSSLAQSIQFAEFLRGLIFDPEHGEDTFLRNARDRVPDCFRDYIDSYFIQYSKLSVVDSAFYASCGDCSWILDSIWVMNTLQRRSATTCLLQKVQYRLVNISFQYNLCVGWDSSDFQAQSNAPSGMDWRLLKMMSDQHGYTNLTAIYLRFPKSP
jgi:hypothetical protein